MRDLLVQLMCYGMLPFIPFSPFLGILGYSWLAYMRPQDLAWSISDARFSMLVAAATLIGLVLSAGRERFMAARVQVYLMIGLLFWVWLAEKNALTPEPYGPDRVDLFFKVVLISVLTTGLVQTKKRFLILFYLIAGSLGTLGLKYGLWGILQGGAQITSGPGGFMIDNNGFAFSLNLGLAMLMGVAMFDPRRWVRILAMVLAAFTALSVIFTFSRGGLVTLAVLAMLLLVRTGKPVLAALVLVLAGAGLFYLTPEDFQQSYLDRAGTISEYEDDQSAMGRIEAWGVAMEMAADYPVFGVGPARFFLVYSQWDPISRPKVCHNAYFQWLTDAGFPGLIGFLSLLAISLLKLQLLRSSRNPQWVRGFAGSLQMAIIAYMAGAMFLDKAYLDLIYHILALTVCLELAAGSAAAEETAPETELETPSAEPWWKQRPAAAATASR